MSFPQSTMQPHGAGTPYENEVIATLFNGSLGDSVHPHVLEAVATLSVQHVLSLPPDSANSRPPFRNINAQEAEPIVSSPGQNANPYWHLTQMPAQSPNSSSQKMFPPSSYDAFWSFVGQQQTAPVTSGLPPCNCSMPSSVIPSPTSEPCRSVAEKARAEFLVKLAIQYPTLADRIRVYDGKDSPFQCNDCHRAVSGNRNAIRRHLIYDHNIFTPTIHTCIFVGCEARMLVSGMPEHIADDHCLEGRVVCGLCGKDFAQSSYAYRHLKEKKCEALRQADRCRLSNRTWPDGSEDST